MFRSRMLRLTLLLVAAAIWTQAPAAANHTSRAALAKRAASGNPAAEVALANQLHKRKKNTAAVTWLRKAAVQNNTEAEWKLGTAYLDGKGVARDFSTALAWMRKSLSDGSGKHMFIYAMMLGSFGAMTGKDKRAAFRKWIHKSAKAGSPMGMVVWAAIEFHGNNGATSNKADAKRWMLKAARTGNADAQTMLGQYYIFGLFGQADIQTGLHWLHEAAHHGGVKAQNLLGILLVTGKKHVPKKAVEGVQWAEQGIEDPTARGSDLGYYALGYAYEHGTGGKKVDFAKAWYDFAAAQRLDIKHQLKDVNVRLSEVAPKLSASQINQLHKNVLKIPLPKKKKGFNP